MAAPDWPLQESPGAFALRGSNERTGSPHLLEHFEGPPLSLDDFHQFRQSPLSVDSPGPEYRCLQRKASSANLAAARLRYTDPAAYRLDEPWTPSLILPRSAQSAAEQNLSTPPAHHQHPRTPRPQTYTASPSLSSSVDTLQSSPFQTPVHQLQIHTELGDEDRSGSTEPLRTKRKFDSLKRAKRLPRQTGGSSGSDGSQGVIWEVYADIFELGVDVGQVVEQGELKKAKSVRFEPAAVEDFSTADARLEERYESRGGSLSSPSSLSQIEWPLPASYDNRQSIIGLFSPVAPPPTPATVLYRGASFDVLNPHASLTLEPHVLETPAEIEALLESYFEDHDDMQDNDNQGESSSASYVPNASSRRVLYGNADDARRNILRIQEENKPQITPPPKAMLSDQGSRKGERPFSEPFDLTLSESGSRNALMSIDNAVKDGRQHDMTSPARMQPLGLGITDLDETHATSEQTTDPTIKEILADYEYTRAPLSQLDTEVEEMDIGTSPSVEYSRGGNAQQLSYGSSHGLISPLQTPEMVRDGVMNKPYGPVALPTPPQPVYTGNPKYANGLHYWTDCSDLPTTEQSYGNTNQLLNITPEEDFQYPPYRPSSPCHPETCVNPAHIHMTPGPIEIYEDPDPDAPITPSVEEFFDDDKENIPPPDYDPEAASRSIHGGLIFRFPDDNEYSDDDGDVAQGMPRSSSFYPDEDDEESEWVTEYGVSQQDLRRNARLSAMSAGSYANTSFVDSQYRFSFTPPAEKALSTIADNSPPASAAPGLFEEPHKTTAGTDDTPDSRRMAIEARISHLESKIAQEQIASGYAGSPKIDLPQRRAELSELDELRGLLPSTTRPFVFKGSESLDVIKANAQLKLQKAKTFVRPQYQPKVIFSHNAVLARQDSAFNSGSDTRGLLASPDTPSPYTNFGYSDSTGTFMTIQKDSPLNMRGPATNLWSPFDEDPTNRAIRVKSPIGKKPKIVDIELGLLGSKSKRSHRAAIGSQFEPRDLHLIKTKRMTDAELAARSAGWTMAPSQAIDSPMRGGTDWSSSSTYAMLLKPENEMERANRHEQKRVSKRFLYGTAAFPPLTLLFGLGFFDKSIARLTSGKVKEACAKEKRNALVVFLPLGVIFWGVLVLAIFLMVTITKGRGQATSSPF